MKRKDVLNTIAYMIKGYDEHAGDDPQDEALRILSYLEDIGMLPPPCSVTIKNGKHTPTERRWEDDEN